MMYNNYFDAGRHIGGFGGGFAGNDVSWAFGPGAFIGLSILGLIFAVWFIISIALKGYTLWTAAKRGEKWWFIALLIINTMGILELIYLIAFAKVSWGKGCCNCGHCGHCDHCKKGEETCEIDEKMSIENEENTKKEAEEIL